MAMYPLVGGLNPFGHFDGTDTELANLLGGEVMTLGSASRTGTSTETGAPDALDGYDYASVGQRVVAKLADTSTQFPLYLCDEGTSPKYFTLFGQMTGPLGVGDGTVVGPHTTSGSGKVTLWSNPGLYGVSVDALAGDFVTSLASGGAGLVPGKVLGIANGADKGKLAHNACTNKVASTGVAHFVEFRTEGGYVNTPSKLVGAAEVFTRIVLDWNGGKMTSRSLA